MHGVYGGDIAAIGGAMLFLLGLALVFWTSERKR